MVGRFDFNTFAMASLAVIFVVFSVSLVSDGIYSQELEEFGYPVEVVDAAPVTEEDTGPAFEPVLPLLASADPGAGESAFRRCASCHAVSDENKVGPGLGGVVNRPIAGHPGFGYSEALTAYAAEAPAWTYEELNGFLWKPKTYVAGTSMGFAGIDSVEDRADVIAYLRSISGDPPLPTEEEIAAVLATDEEPTEAEAAIEGEVVPEEPAGETSEVVADDAIEAAPLADETTPAVAPADAAVDATADGAVGDAGSAGAPLAVPTETGQGVPGNETAGDSVVDPDDLNPRNVTDDDPAAGVLPDGTIIDDAIADDAIADGVPVAPLGDGEVPGARGFDEEAIENAGDGVVIDGGATPVAPVTPELGAPEVEGVVVDPTPDPVIVVDPEAAPAVDGAEDGGVTRFRVPIQ